MTVKELDAKIAELQARIDATLEPYNLAYYGRIASMREALQQFKIDREALITQEWYHLLKHYLTHVWVRFFRRSRL